MTDRNHNGNIQDSLQETAQNLTETISTSGRQFIDAANDGIEQVARYHLTLKHENGNVIFRAPVLPSVFGLLLLLRFFPRQLSASVLVIALLMRAHLTVEDEDEIIAGPAPRTKAGRKRAARRDLEDEVEAGA